jgi:hypothetical protein
MCRGEGRLRFSQIATAGEADHNAPRRGTTLPGASKTPATITGPPAAQAAGFLEFSFGRMNHTSNQVQCCGVCERYTAHGDAMPSGKRNARGETPCDNWICRRCQNEARGLDFLGKATAKFLRERGLDRNAA